VSERESAAGAEVEPGKISSNTAKLLYGPVKFKYRCEKYLQDFDFLGS
jgi:hypothetical protein